MLLLDTDDFPPDQRADAFRAAFARTSTPVAADPMPSGAGFSARVQSWQFGGATLMAVDSSGHRLATSPRQAVSDGSGVASVTFTTRGAGWLSQFGRDHTVGPRDVVLADLTAPCSCTSIGANESRSLRIPYDQLGLTVALVREAAPQLPASPLYDLVRRHLHDLAGRAEELAGDSSAAAFGSATTDLVRALITSALRDQRFDRPVMAETLMTRVTAYVGLHVAEPDLTAERIARTQHVSLRQLYKACAEAQLSLEQWIIDQRLELARTALASPAGRRRSIAATALACGFADPSHFSRRFRAAFGTTPRGWRQAALTEGAPPAARDPGPPVRVSNLPGR